MSAAKLGLDRIWKVWYNGLVSDDATERLWQAELQKREAAFSGGLRALPYSCRGLPEAISPTERAVFCLTKGL